MQKQHGLAVRADLRHAVAEHARALLDQGVARRDDIRNVIANVVDAAVRIALKKFGDRRSFAERLDKFDLGIGQRRKHGDDAMLRQRHRRGNIGAERGAVNPGGLLGVLDCNGYVIEPAQHGISPVFP